MPELLGTAEVQIQINTSNVTGQLNNIKSKVNATTQSIDKNFSKTFMSVSNAAIKMGRQVSAVLKMISVPAIGLVGLSIKKFLDSKGAEGKAAAAEWFRLKTEVNGALASVGNFALKSNILGKTAFQWVDTFANALKKLTQGDIQKLINSLTIAAGIIGAIKVGTIVIKGAQAGIKGFESLEKWTKVSAGTDIAGSVVGGGIMAWITKLLGKKITSIPRDIQHRELLPGESTKLIDGKTVSVMPGIGSRALSALGKGGIVAGIIAGVLFIAGLVSQLDSKANKAKSSLGVIGNALEDLMSFFDSFGKATVALFSSIKNSLSLLNGFKIFSDMATAMNNGYTYIQALDYSTKNFVDALKKVFKPIKDYLKGEPSMAPMSKSEIEQERINLYANREEAYKKQKNKKMMDTPEGSVELRLERHAKEQELYYGTEDIFTNFDRMIKSQEEISRISRATPISEKAEKAQTKLNDEAAKIQRNWAKNLADEEYNFNKSKRDAAGQFMAGTEAIKFTQQIESQKTSKEEEHRRRIEDINLRGNEMMDENRKETKLLNDNFTKFLNYVTRGLDPDDLASNLGL